MRYEVTITQTQITEEKVYITADSLLWAEAQAEADYDENGIVEADVVDTDVRFMAVPISEDHNVEPYGTGPGEYTCNVCDQPCRWTGSYDNDGRTIPGPWVHVEA